MRLVAPTTAPASARNPNQTAPGAMGRRRIPRPTARGVGRAASRPRTRGASPARDRRDHLPTAGAAAGRGGGRSRQGRAGPSPRGADDRDRWARFGVLGRCLCWGLRVAARAACPIPPVVTSGMATRRSSLAASGLVPAIVTRPHRLTELGDRLADLVRRRAADLALVDLLVGLALQVLQLLVHVLALALLGGAQRLLGLLEQVLGAVVDGALLSAGADHLAQVGQRCRQLDLGLGW